jgi:hypothetical protein
MYRIRRNGPEPIIDVDQVEAIEPAIRSSKRGVTMWMKSVPIRCLVGPREATARL